MNKMIGGLILFGVILFFGACQANLTEDSIGSGGNTTSSTGAGNTTPTISSAGIIGAVTTPPNYSAPGRKQQNISYTALKSLQNTVPRIPSGKEVTVYYPVWQQYDRKGAAGPGKLPYGSYTNIMVSFFRPLVYRDGSQKKAGIIGSDPWGDRLVLLGAFNWGHDPPFRTGALSSSSEPYFLGQKYDPSGGNHIYPAGADNRAFLQLKGKKVS